MDQKHGTQKTALAQATTEELIVELANREGVELAQCGDNRARYQAGYRLTKVFTQEQNITARLLIIR